MNINKININQTEPTYYIASDIYDVSYHNNDTSFESLQSLLNSDNLSIFIPTEVRCGGMTIRFVQSSDNKYVQYRLLSNIFSTNKNDWQEILSGTVSTAKITDGAVTRDKISFNDVLNRSFVLNSNPWFEQGEFNYLYDPIEFNDTSIRIRTIFNINAIKSISITNTEEYKISAGFFTNSLLDLSQANCKKTVTINNKVDILENIKDITSFTPAYLVLSFKRVDGANITPDEGKNIGLVIEPLNAIVSTDRIANEAITTEKLTNGAVTRDKISFNDVLNRSFSVNSNPWFEQGEFNFTYDPIEFNDTSIRIRTIFNINAIKSISITNTDEYRIVNGIFTNPILDLSQTNCKIATISNNRIDILENIKDITSFAPSYLILSFSRTDGANITPDEGKSLGLVIEQLNTIVTRDKISFNDTLNRSFVLNSNPWFEQGEFNYNFDPIVLNTALTRIRTVFNISCIKSISITNTSTYLLANGFYTNSLFDLSNANIVKSKTLWYNHTKIDVLEDIRDITNFTPIYLVLSFKRVDGTNITPEEGESLGLVIEPLNVIKELDLISNNVDRTIVCFGDSLTAGDGVGEYPKELQNILGNGYYVNNQGVGGETSHTILARLGSEIMYSQKDITFSASSNSPVEIANGTQGVYLKNKTTSADISPLLQNVLERVNPCYINGIECNMTVEPKSTNGSLNIWYISPVTPTDYDITIKSGTPIIGQASKNCRNKDILILWVGTNDGDISNNVEIFCNRLKNAINYANPKEYIIVNPHVWVLTELDDLLSKEFGNSFFNWREYVSKYALYELGITPTTQETLTDLQKENGVVSDVVCMQNGTLPSSLWRRAFRAADDPLNDTGTQETSKDNCHMNVTGYRILAKKLSELIHELGM